jgi:TonB-dependent receptor
MAITVRKEGFAALKLLGASTGVLALAMLSATPARAQTAATQPVPETQPAPADQAATPSPAVGEATQTVGAEGAGGDAAATQAAEAPADEIVVTGFRRSLEAALDIKRDTVSSVDAIVAEDIAKFPDQNLAESLQRIPGISIQREGGEGRSITVRGLGAQFTRVRVNGLETIATSTEGAASNRDRAFDFNVFASELFNSIVVHKTAEASLDEGSLGAVVDLNTGNPLAGRRGVTFVTSVQGSYNTLSKDLGPRVAGLLSWKSPEGNFGASVSAAYQQNNVLELGNNTVRWQQARFDSVNGTPCFTRPNSGGTYVPSANCDAVALAFHPRIPRYGEVGHDRERLGLTAGVQWAPSDRTMIELNGLYSSFKEDREENWAEVLFRGNERAIDVVDFAIDPGTGNLVSGTFNDAWVRTEHYLRTSQTKFHQLSATLKQDITDTLRVSLLGGFSKSDADIPRETTFVFDDRDAQGYRYDYTNSRRPVLAFGTSATDPANFQLAEIRDRPSNVTNKFRTLQLNGEWDITDDIGVEAGGLYRRFSFDSAAFTRDTVVCPTRAAAGPDAVLGTITCSPSSVFGPSAVYGFPVTAGLAETFDLGRAGQPEGTTTSWLVPNLDAAAEFTGLYGRTPTIDAGNTRAVVEKVRGGYLEGNVKGELGGLRYAANAGVRYVRTDQTSTGLTNGLPVTIERDYDDWLPSANVALFPSEDFIIRGAIAKVLTRPTLGNLTPGGSVDGFNYRVNFGNPFLEPFRATAYDVSFEWYFAPQSIASVALFAKDVKSFPVSATRSGTFASTGLPLSVITPSSPAASNPEGQPWTISSITNGEGATLKGVELSLQAPFTFLPGILSNFGGIVNATFVDSDADYDIAGPAAVPGGPLVSERRSATLFGLSKRAVNATLYYEDEKFSARTSVSYRSGFLDATSATGNIFEGYNSTINVDASVRYKISEALELSLEGINLTDEYRDRFTDVDANRNYEYNHFGRTILFGARFKM